MRASSKRVLSVGIAAIFLLGSLIVYTALIRPTYDKIQKQRASVISAESIFTDQKNATDQVTKAFADMKNVSKVREVITEALPVGPGMTQALQRIQAIVRANQVNIDALAIKEGSPESNKQLLAKRLGKLELNFAVSGKYENVRNFLKALETDIRVTNITDVTFSPTGVNGKTGVSDLYSAQVVAEMYYQEN